MSDKIDDMFADDMRSLKGPSELSLHLRKTASEDEGEEKDEEKKKSKIPPQFLSKLKGKKKAEGKEEKDEEKEEGEKKEAACSGKPMGPGRGPRDGTGPHNPLLKKMKKKTEKKASLDDTFDAELRQAVGLDVESADPEWQRPDVAVEGQVTDRIDDHYLSWMKAKADEDVVKEAESGTRKILREIFKTNDVEAARKLLAKKLRHAGYKGAGVALGGTGLLAGGAVAGHQVAKRTGVAGDGEKQAAFEPNPENMSLIDKIRAKSGKLFGDS